jgi:hypothetical protein
MKTTLLIVTIGDFASASGRWLPMGIRWLTPFSRGHGPRAGALQVAAVCRSIADSGRTVVCTIHQLSRFVFEMFDTLLFLQNESHDSS